MLQGEGRAQLFLFCSWGRRKQKHCDISTFLERFRARQGGEKSCSCLCSWVHPQNSWILLELNNCWVVHSQLCTKNSSSWFDSAAFLPFFVSLVSIYFLCIWMLVKATDIEGYTYSWRNRSLKKSTHLLFIIHDSLFIIHFFLYS